jgi:hypothetical protein
MFLDRRAAGGGVAELSSNASAYATAFDEVSDEINFVIAGVISNLIAFGPAETLTGVSGLEVKATQPPTVSFLLLGDQLAQTGRIYWTNDSLITDAVCVEAVRYAEDNVHGARFALDATVLVGTATAWR